MTQQSKTKPIVSLLDAKSLALNQIKAYIKRSYDIKTALQTQSWEATCKGKHVLSVFFEHSTRTRVSFELAIHQLGAKPILFDVALSSTKKGETLEDMMQNLEALGVDAFVIRHYENHIPHQVASYVNKPIINAGDGSHEHPTQALLDVFSIEERLGDDWKNRRILICGDILHSRVAHSNMWLLKTLGAEVFVSGPKALIPNNLDDYEATYIENIDTILGDVDAINVLRIQTERQEQEAQDAFQSQQDTKTRYPYLNKAYYKEHFGITKDRLKTCKDHVLILHPGPVNRGVEIDLDVMKSPRSIILKQVENGPIMRMACLEHCLLAT